MLRRKILEMESPLIIARGRSRSPRLEKRGDGSALDRLALSRGHAAVDGGARRQNDRRPLIRSFALHAEPRHVPVRESVSPQCHPVLARLEARKLEPASRVASGIRRRWWLAEARVDRHFLNPD